MAEYYSEESVPYDDDESTLGSEDDEDLNFSGGDSEDGAGIKRGAGTSCQVLTPDMISKKMFDIIHDVNAVFEVRMAWIYTSGYINTAPPPTRCPPLMCVSC